MRNQRLEKASWDDLEKRDQSEHPWLGEKEET